MSTQSALDALIALLGKPHVQTEEDTLAFYASDLFFSGTLPVAVVSPGTRDDLCQTVTLCTEAGIMILPRGGGLSYTAGYIQDDDEAEAIVLDTRRLNRIINIRPDDLTVTVECGCTWEQVMDATSDHGLRVTMFGPSTGRYSTIGGSLSNNCMFFGSAKTGTSADAVLGLEVVASDGRVIVTGSDAIDNGVPFFRNNGPDLTGLFLNDAGALGIKTVATLRLEPIPAGIAFSTFSFENFDALIPAIQSVGRSGLASECLGVGPISEKGRPALHVVTEGWTQEIAEVQMAVLSGLMGSGGKCEEPAIPTFIRSEPFSFTQSPLDPKGRLQIWTHGVFSLGETSRAYDAFKSVLKTHAESMKSMEIEATLSFAVAGNAMMVEPVLYWPGPATPLHLKGMSETALSGVQMESTEADTKVREIRNDFRESMNELGAAHMQYGRFYPYATVTSPSTVNFLKDIKLIVDPGRLLNPGVLGL